MNQQDMGATTRGATDGPEFVGLYGQLSEKSRTYLARLARDLLDQEKGGGDAGRIGFRPNGLRLIVGGVS